MRTILWFSIFLLAACSDAARVSGSIESTAPDGLLVALQPPVVPSAVVRADGSFSFPSVPHGDYQIIVVRAGVDRSTATTISVEDDLSGLLLHAPPALAGVTGSVDPGGRPGVIHVHLVAAQDSAGDAPTHGVVLEAPGEFEVRNVPPGRYRVRAFADNAGLGHFTGDQAAARSSVLTVGDSAPAAIALVLATEPASPPDIEGLRASPLPGGAMLTWPAAGASSYQLYLGGDDVSATSNSESRALSEHTHDDGTVRVAVLTESTHATVASQRQSKLGAAAAPVSLAAEVTGSHTLTGTTNLTGRVFVGVVGDVERWTMASGGAFAIERIPAGPYRVVAFSDADADGQRTGGERGSTSQLLWVPHTTEYDVVVPDSGVSAWTTVEHTRFSGTSRFGLTVHATAHGSPIIYAAMAQSRALTDLYRFPHRMELGPARPSAQPVALGVLYAAGPVDIVEAPVTPLLTVSTPVTPLGLVLDQVTPTFTWEAEDHPNLTAQALVRKIQGSGDSEVDLNGQILWLSPPLDSGQRTAAYSFDGSGAPLVVGNKYGWGIRYTDAAGNTSEDLVQFGP